MGQIKGIKYTNSGGRRYVRVDLDMYGEYQALEDFLDLVEIEAQKGQETVSLDEFNRRVDEILQAKQRKGIKYTNSGGRRYARVDLDMYGGNQALEDFLDLVEIEAQKDEPKKNLRDVIMEQNQKRGMNVQSNNQ